MFAEVNKHGFIESPYREVVRNNGHSNVTDNIQFLSADDEDRVMIAQSDENTDKNKMLTNDHIRARIKGDFPIVTPDMVQYNLS